MNSALFWKPGRWLVIAAVLSGLMPISSAALRARGMEDKILARRLLLIMRDEGFKKRLHRSLRGLHNSPTENGGGSSLRPYGRPMDKDLLRKLIEEIEKRREGNGELLRDLAIVLPQPKAPPRKPKIIHAIFTIASSLPVKRGDRPPTATLPYIIFEQSYRYPAKSFLLSVSLSSVVF